MIAEIVASEYQSFILSRTVRRRERGRVAMTIRVVQWTTGNVGQRSVRARSQRTPTSSWSAVTRGRTTRSAATRASFAGIDPMGVAATDDVDALLALKPDVVVYNPMWHDTDEVVRILEAGVNVVSTAAFINGRGLGEGRDRIADACTRGGVYDVRHRDQPRLRRAARHRNGQPLRPHRQGHDPRGRRLDAVRLTGHRAARRVRAPDRRPGAARR